MPTNMAAAAAGAAVDGAAATGISTELVHERPELKVLTWTKEKVASDALLITGITSYRYRIQGCLLLETNACCTAGMPGKFWDHAAHINLVVWLHTMWC